MSLVVAAAASAMAVGAVPAQASGGGTGTGGGGDGSCNADAKLVSLSKAQAPDCAPGRVKRVIRAANEISKGKDYCLGGGHGSWNSSCYDCSGAVSYALHGGDLLDSPLDSSGLARWGKRGRGEWITVYANSGHAYAVIAGVRFDTSSTPGKGPGWSDEMRSSDGFKKRHKGRL